MTEDEEGARLADAYELEVKAAALREFAQLVSPAEMAGRNIITLAHLQADQAEAQAEELRSSVPVPFDTCHVVEVDGEPVRVQGGADLDAEGRAALGSVVRAAKRRLVEEKAAERAGVVREVRAEVVGELEALRDGVANKGQPYNEAFMHALDCAIRTVRGEA